MSWQQLIFQTHSTHGEALGDILTQYGAFSVTIKDAGDMPIFEPPVDETPLWPEIVINGLFPADQDLQPVMQQLTKQLSAEPEFKIEILEDKDWIREWMDNYQPMKFGQRLWICPSWSTPPETNAVNIFLDPGLAFGTGTHATTSLCLQWLDHYANENDLTHQTVLDFGCGSGILSVAALKLGAKLLYAVDIDPQAIAATNANAEKNHVIETLRCYSGNEFANQFNDLQVDIVLANILANPLVELSHQIASHVKPGGKLVLSGILENQVEKVLNAYHKNFDFADIVVQDEWVRMVANKKK